MQPDEGFAGVAASHFVAATKEASPRLFRTGLRQNSARIESMKFRGAPRVMLKRSKEFR